MPDKSEEWLAERSKTLGSHASAAILGRHPFLSSLDVYESMRGESEPVPDNDDMRRGRLFEPIAFDLLMEGGIAAVPHAQHQFVYSSQYPWAHALPDGWCEQTPVEIKWPRPGKYKSCVLTGLPEDYMVMAQHQMAVIGVKMLIFTVCCPLTARSFVVNVERDDRFCESLMEYEAQFYEQVIKGIPPEGIEQPEGLDIPRTEGPMRVISNPSAQEAAQAYEEALDLFNDAKVIKDLAEQRLKVEAEGCELFEVRGEVPMLRVYNQEHETKRFDSTRFRKDHPKLYEDYLKITVSRPFRVYPLNRQKALPAPQREEETT